MSASMVQSVSKNELGCIKGLGTQRVEAIVRYRQENKINNLEELLNVKGIGKKILNNIQTDTKKKVCTTFGQSTAKKVEHKKKDIKAE
jgi:competence ComEA-like helix-hairpin-helix protein